MSADRRDEYLEEVAEGIYGLIRYSGGRQAVILARLREVDARARREVRQLIELVRDAGHDPTTADEAEGCGLCAAILALTPPAGGRARWLTA